MAPGNQRISLIWLVAVIGSTALAVSTTLHSLIVEDAFIDPSAAARSLLTTVLLLWALFYLRRLLVRDYEDLKRRIEELIREADERNDAILAGQLHVLAEVRKINSPSSKPFELI